jgi:hypothetical protein
MAASMTAIMTPVAGSGMLSRNRPSPTIGMMGHPPG